MLNGFEIRSSNKVRVRKGKGDRGIVLAETANGERFMASTEEPAIVSDMKAACPIERRIDVQPLEKGLAFSFGVE